MSEKNIDRIIRKLFSLLLFLTPLIFVPWTTELFEFNKIVFLYASTSLIVFFWILKIIKTKKFIRRKTLIDVPLILFLLSQLLSTIFSIDRRISLLGNFTRFNGGFLSSLCYALLFGAWISNMDKKASIKALVSIFSSSVLVGAYAVMQRIGIDKNIWVQQSQKRVFSTIGQPNWLAAYIVILLPIVWALGITLKEENRKKKLWKLTGLTFLHLLLITSLSFTKSRSGLLAVSISGTIFWIPVILNKNNRNISKAIFIAVSSALILIIAGAPWIKLGNLIPLDSYRDQISESTNQNVTTASEEPLLQSGGVESAVIRKIVWKGAFNIWKHYPIFGSGVETFARVYNTFRPVEHNTASEWDFIYDKAHNEFLNYLATTGSFGFLAYITFCASILATYFFSEESKTKIFNSGGSIKKTLKEVRNFQCLKKDNKLYYESLGFGAGFVGVMVSNFFGFSVTSVSLLTFMLPAIFMTLSKEGVEENKLNIKIPPYLPTAFLIIALFLIGRYWYADFLFARGTSSAKINDFNNARNFVIKSLKISNEPIYWNGLSKITTELVITYPENDQELLASLPKEAIDESEEARKLSPKNVDLYRDAGIMFIKLSLLDPNYMYEAEKVITEATKLAPTDAKLWYNLALTQYRLGKAQEAKETLIKTIELKNNYEKAYLALGLVYSSLGEKEKAVSEIEYVLQNINPESKQAKQFLEEIR